MRTNKSPQRSWLYQLAKTDGKDCPQCGHHTQDGEHLTFACPAHDRARNELIGGRASKRLLIKNPEGEREEYVDLDGTELFFAYLFDQLT